MNLINEIDFFIEKNNLYTLIIGSIFSQFLSEVFNSFTNDIIMSLLNTDVNSNGYNDINEIKNKKLTIHKFTIKYGSFMISLIRFSIVIIILLIINRLRFNNKKNN